MHCPACGASNAEGSASCYACAQVLLPTLQRGSVVASRYEVLAHLGSGGMGAVYKAHDRVLDETVALKVLRPEIAWDVAMARRFQSEIKLARKVTHRNVCRIHDYGQDQGLLYLSMEFVAGTNLKRVLEAQGGLLPEGAFEVANEIAQGLQAIHDVGIIHRDLKTANIMLDSRGVVRLMDFGIAKERGGFGQSTATGVILGTPEYMSPEQVRGEPLDFRSDVYALGIVLFELFTGRVPFRGSTVMATLYQQVHELAPLNEPRAEGVPESAKTVLARALAKPPASRYATVREMSEALSTAQAALFAAPPTVAARAEPSAVAPVAAARDPTLELPAAALPTETASPLLAAIDALLETLQESPIVDRLLEVLLERAQKLTGASSGRVLLLDGFGLVEAAAGDGCDELRGLALETNEGIATLVAEAGTVVRLADASAHPRYSPRCDALPAAPGFLAAPLRFGSVRGAVLLAGHAPAGFGPAEEAVLTRLVRHGAVFLDRAVSSERSLDAFTHATDILLSFLEAIDVRYPEHSRAVASLADMVAPRLGLGEEDQLHLHFAALLHDVGKIRMDPAVLRAPGPLSPEAVRQLREHVVLGVQLIAPLSPLREVPRLVHAHHEHWDGSGYPRGLAGEAIPLGARIIAVADAFDAIQKQDPSRSEEQALAELARAAGSQFDPRVVEQFAAALREGLARLGRAT